MATGAGPRKSMSGHVGTHPSALAVDPDGRLWVADAGSDDVRVVDPAGRARPRTVPVGSRPSAIAIGTTAAFVADQGSDDVRRIDLKTLRPIGRPIQLPARSHDPVAIAVDDAGRAWVASRSGDVTVIADGTAGPPTYVGHDGAISIAASNGTWVGTQDGTLVHLSDSAAPIGAPRQFHEGAVSVATFDDTLWIATRDEARLRSMSTSTRGAAPSRPVNLTPAQTPAALTCAARRCVVSDTPTRTVVGARF
jgi:YVTN family beta-propeller protein